MNPQTLQEMALAAADFGDAPCKLFSALVLLDQARDALRLGLPEFGEPAWRPEDRRDLRNQIVKFLEGLK